MIFRQILCHDSCTPQSIVVVEQQTQSNVRLQTALIADEEYVLMSFRGGTSKRHLCVAPTAQDGRTPHDQRMAGDGQHCRGQQRLFLLGGGLCNPTPHSLHWSSAGSDLGPHELVQVQRPHIAEVATTCHAFVQNLEQRGLDWPLDRQGNYCSETWFLNEVLERT